MTTTTLARLRVKLIQDGSGLWHIVNADTYQRLATLGGEAEALAHAAENSWYVTNPYPRDRAA